MRLRFWLFLTVSLLVGEIANAQQPTPTLTPHEALLAEIETLAARYVQRDTSYEASLPLVIDRILPNANGILTRNQIEDAYDAAYTIAQKANKKTSWEELRDELLPSAGWIATGLLVIVFIFQEYIKKKVTALIDRVGESITARMSNQRKLHHSLERYKNSLANAYTRFKPPFGERELNMDDVYIPLKFLGGTDTEQIDVIEAMQHFPRLVITGEPGSGKSKLLEYIALGFAKRNFLNDELKVSIPVIVPLSRFSDSERRNWSVNEHIVKALENSQFKDAKDLAVIMLNDNKLILLFDGFDEVGKDERADVAKDVIDFGEQYPECRMVITSRTAAYYNEFNDLVNKQLEIVGFVDQQIQQFLLAWDKELEGYEAQLSVEQRNRQVEMRRGKPMGQLRELLDESPKLKEMARSPLMLTMITYLYTDTPHILPKSRTEFYRQATDELLRNRRRDKTQNQFTVEVKERALRHLAVRFQEQKGHDRRTVEYFTMIEWVKEFKSGLSLEDKEIIPLIDEIVVASGLMQILPEKPQRMQFTHLTLQEYFAAIHMLQKPEELIAQFKNDPQTWRETIKLWCGITGNSTHFVEQVFEIDPITAFDCLADAVEIDPKTVKMIVDHFRSQLGSGEEVILKAFGAVAADARPGGQGKPVFNFLVNTLQDNENEAIAKAAARALSLTNLPEAAKILAEYYDLTYASMALLRMGDLAVPELAKRLVVDRVIVTDETAVNNESFDLSPALNILSDNLLIIDDLLQIGTPKAARALADLLWHQGWTYPTFVGKVAVTRTFAGHLSRAAWNLATMLQNPIIEDDLRRYPLTETQRKAPFLNYIWTPFEPYEPENSALPVIAARVAYLINETPEVDIPNVGTIDARIVVPLWAEGLDKERIKLNIRWIVKDDKKEEFAKELAKFSMLKHFPSLDNIERTTDTVIGRIDLVASGEIWLKYYQAKQFVSGYELLDKFPRLSLFRLLNVDIQDRLIERLLTSSRAVTRGDWLNLFKPDEYQFSKSWHFRLVNAIYIFTSLVAVIQMISIIRTTPSLLSWHNAWLVAGILGIPIVLLLANVRDTYTDMVLSFLFLGPLGVIRAVINNHPVEITGNVTWNFVGSFIFFSIITGLAAAWMPLIFVFAALALWHRLPLPVVMAIIVITISVCMILVLYGERRDRIARNPLRGVIDQPGEVQRKKRRWLRV